MDYYTPIMSTNSSEPVFIKEPIAKEKVYSMWLAQLDRIEQSTISNDFEDRDRASENAMDIGFRLFPIIDSIALNLLGKLNGRKYLKRLGYSSKESDMIYTMFRNGMMHGRNPYRVEYDDGEVSWGLMSSSGSSGIVPHFPGYTDPKNPQFNHPADKAFTYTKLSEGLYHASLSLTSFLSHIRYDLIERQKNDERDTIEFIVGQKIKGKTPTIK